MRSAIRSGDRAGGARAQTEHAALCADPEVVFVVLEESEHIVVWKRRRRREPDDPARLKTHQPLTVGSDPQFPPAAFEQHADVGAAQYLGGHKWIAVDALVESAETGNGSNPEGPVGCLADCPNTVVGQALIGSVVRRLHPAQNQQSPTSYQQASCAVLANGMRADLGRAVTAIHADQRFILHAEETGVRPDPEPAVSVFVNDPDEAVSESFSGAEDTEPPVLISDQPAAFRSRPQRSVFRDEQRIDAVIRKSWCVLAIEDHERHAVETRQPTASAYPQVAILSLRQRLREVFGQSIRAAPHAAAVGGGVRRRSFRNRRRCG